jgi:hypothetical protein
MDGYALRDAQSTVSKAWEKRAYQGSPLALVLLRRTHLKLLMVGFRLCRSLW